MRTTQSGRCPTSTQATHCAAGSLGPCSKGLPQLTDALTSERGTILPLMALLLVVLLGAAGFAVDFGWVYWNSIEIQHGADAAALAGVVYTAEDPDKAKQEGRAIAATNGYFDESLGGPDIVEIIDFADDENAVENDSERPSPTRFRPTS